MADQSPTPDRPSLMASYGVDRALRDEMLDWEDVRARLEGSRNYWVCTTRADGRPHVAPVWGLWMEGAFFFSTDASSVKGRNLAARPDVIVHLESGDDVVIVEGQAERVADRATLGRMVDAYEQKYAIRFDPADPNFAVYAVRPSRAYAWTEQSFPTTATRWRFAGAVRDGLPGSVDGELPRSAHGEPVEP